MLEGLKPPRNKKYVCKVATSIEKLDTADGEVLAAAINDEKTWPAHTLATELGKRGLPLSDMTILRHRKKSCVCYRQEIG